jgi:hypothetical protein
MTTTRATFATLLLAASLHAQEAKQPFFTKTTAGLFAADVAAKSFDYALTRRNFSTGTGKEDNPLLRPFMTHGKAVAAASTFGALAGETFLSWQLHKHGHRKLSRAVWLIGIASNTYGAIYSAKHFHHTHGGNTQ